MENKKTIMILLIMLLTTTPLWSQRFMVLYANSSNITIGGKRVQKNMIFDYGEKIVWSSDKQALKVKNLSSGLIRVIPAKDFELNKSVSLYDYLHKRKHLSTRDINSRAFDVDTAYYLLDTLKIDAGRYYGKGTTDEIIAKVNGRTIRTAIERTLDKQQFILTRKIYDDLSAQVAYFDILETDAQMDWKYFIYRRIRIELLPLQTE